MTPPRCLAVLIDADNASPKIAADLFDQIAKIGDATVRRIYGDFSGTQLKSWLDILPDHAIQPHHHSANTAGKNATDIALVIDAMDLLHSGAFDGFCLVSSDSDFTRLASRIREQGLRVIGFGERDKSPQSFTMACDEFVFTDRFGKPKHRPKQKPKPPTALDAAPLLWKALTKVQPDREGWYLLSSIGKAIRQIDPDFAPKRFGCATLANLAIATGAFETGGPEGKPSLRPKVRAE